MVTLSEADIERFHSFYLPVTESGCWLWEKGNDKDGYGFFYIKSKTFTAHRVSYLLHHGPIAKGLQVLHRCDNPYCVNPQHLFLGTNKENMSDKVNKNRQVKGQSIAWAKLTDQDVFEIRSVYPRFTQRELARLYSVTQPLIGMILRGSVWKHVAV